MSLNKLDKRAQKIRAAIEKTKNIIPSHNPITQSDGYVRPQKTFTDNLSKEEIRSMLDDYIQVTHDELATVKLGTHIRYFITDPNGVQHFRLGGILLNVSGVPVYIVLGNGRSTWSAQMKGSTFFKKLTVPEFRAKIANECKAQTDGIIEMQKREILKLKTR